MKGNKIKHNADVDYIVLYAKSLKKDNSLFRQQKGIIEAQLHGSSSLFRNMFAGGDFKTLARKYLREVGVLS